jgi:hypothetical protein
MGIADVITKQAILDLVRPLLDEAHPVGSQYIQYPANASNDYAEAFPVAERPATLFGGTWTTLWETEAIFFRTGGTQAAESDRTFGWQSSMFGSHTHGVQCHYSYDTGRPAYYHDGRHTPTPEHINTLYTDYAGGRDTSCKQEIYNLEEDGMKTSYLLVEGYAGI